MKEDGWADDGLFSDPPKEEDYAWLPSGPVGENPLKGKYRLDWEFEGAKGRLWVGRQLPLGRVVLIKVLGPDSRAEAVRRQLRLEAEACAGAASPNTVALFDFDETDDGIPFLVFEYVAGVNLAQALRISSRFELTRAVRVVAQVARGLSLLHRRGFVHGDIRPPNLLLLRSPESGQELLKILDFGRVQRIPSGSDTGTTFESGPEDPAPRDPRYLSPEQILGHPPSPAIDLYALGLLLFEMLSGAPPFGGGGATEAEIRHQQLNIPPPGLGTRVSELTGSAIETLVAHCLAKAPEDRPASALALREALSDACGLLIGEAGGTVGAPTLTDDLWVDARSPVPEPPPAPHASLSNDLVLSADSGEGPIPESVYADEIPFRESVYADEVPTLIQETPDWAMADDEEPTPTADAEDDVVDERTADRGDSGAALAAAEAESLPDDREAESLPNDREAVAEALSDAARRFQARDAASSEVEPPRDEPSAVAVGSASDPSPPDEDSAAAAASAEAERLPKASVSAAALPGAPMSVPEVPIVEGSPLPEPSGNYELPVLPPWSESSPMPPRTSRDPVTRPDGQYFRPGAVKTPFVAAPRDTAFDEPSPAPPLPPPTPLPQPEVALPPASSRPKLPPPREPPKLHPPRRKPEPRPDPDTQETRPADPLNERKSTGPRSEPWGAASPFAAAFPPAPASLSSAGANPPISGAREGLGGPGRVAAVPGTPSPSPSVSSSEEPGRSPLPSVGSSGTPSPFPLMSSSDRSPWPSLGSSEGSGRSPRPSLGSSERSGRSPLPSVSASGSSGGPTVPPMGPPERASTGDPRLEGLAEAPLAPEPAHMAPPARQVSPASAPSNTMESPPNFEEVGLPSVMPATRPIDPPPLQTALPSALTPEPPTTTPIVPPPSRSSSGAASLADALFRDATPFGSAGVVPTGEVPIRSEEVFVSGASTNGAADAAPARATGTPPALRIFREDRARIARIQERDSTGSPARARPRPRSESERRPGPLPPASRSNLPPTSQRGAWFLLAVGLMGMSAAVWMFLTTR